MVKGAVCVTCYDFSAFLLDLVSFCEAFAEFTSTFEIFKNIDNFYRVRLTSDPSRYNQYNK